MNSFALNAAALNGSSEVWIDAVAAVVELQAEGSASAGVMVGGAAGVQAQASIEEYSRITLVGDAVIQLASSGELIYGRPVEGGAEVNLGASGDGVRWVLPDASGAIAWEAEGDGQVVGPISADFDIVCAAGMDGLIAGTVMGEGVASLVFNGAGALMIGTTLSAEASITIDGDGSGYALIQAPSAEAEIQLVADGELGLGLGLVGAASIQLQGSLDPRAIIQIGGSANVAVEGYGESMIGQSLQGSGQIVVLTSLLASIQAFASGDAIIEVASDGSPDSIKAGMLSAEASIVVASIGEGYAIVQSTAGDAHIALASMGELRIGEKLFGEGNAEFQLFARGSLGSIHYEYGEGSATIEFDAVIERFGRPDLPVEYVPAPAARTFMVQKSSRTLTVQRDNRSL